MNDSELELILEPETTRRPAIRRPRFSAGECGVEFAVSAAELSEAFELHRMYPVQLASTLDADAVQLFQRWLQSTGFQFCADDSPWVPVGRVGPLLVLGHVKVGVQPPPLPWGTFQAVSLRCEDYEQQLTHVAALLEGMASREVSVPNPHRGGVGRFPKTLVMPSDRLNAWKFLGEYFHHSPEAAAILERHLDNEGVECGLPPEYFAAQWFLLAQGAVVQPLNLRLSEPTQRRLPEGLRRRVTAIFECERHLWCASSSLPQVEIEDRLYAELGEGWTIHWLLSVSENQRVTDFAATHSSASPAKIVLPSTLFQRADKRDLIEAEERLIILEERDWIRFDPRHRDSSSPESLWKWSIYKALQEGSTDLHIEPGIAVARVRQRVDGMLEEILEVSSGVGEAMVYSLMTQVGLGSDKYRPVDGSFQVELKSKDANRAQTARVRASAYPVRGVTQKLALRFLPRQGAVPDLENLLPVEPTRYMRRAISRNEGLVLVCGPTGSGKTTTLFSALSALNRPDVNVTTLENPVEILLEGANQAEINERRDVTWASLNRAFLRQDPDVGLIGEIRDEDTAKTILRAALTGHLVFGSLHTKSCATSVVRMIDLGADPNMLAESLILVVCQRLIRRLCGKCRTEYSPRAEERALFESHRLPVAGKLFRPGVHSQDCDHCRGRGYRGRIAAVEVLPNVPSIRRMIEEQAVSQDYTEWMRTHRLPTVFENALELAAAGSTSMNEAMTLQDAWEGPDWENLYA